MSTIEQGTSAPGTRGRTAKAFPGGRLLSNGRYAVLLTHAGGGVSRCGSHALTRATADPLEDVSGLAIWVRDLADGRAFTLGLEPAGHAAERYETRWEPGIFTLVHEQDGIEAKLEICVAADADAEIRRVTLAERAGRERRLDVTTAAEIVLHHPAADAGHPAFSKLFVQTSFDAAARAILAHRRPRGNDERHPALVHALLESGAVSCETDRVRWLGRGRAPSRPAAMDAGECLSGTVGNVLDPVACLRRELVLPANGTATLTFVLGVAGDAAGALALVRRLGAGGAVDAAFAGAREHALASLRAAGVTAVEAEDLQALGAAMIAGDPALRAPADELLRDPREAVPLRALGLAPGRPLIVARAGAGDLASLEAARSAWGALGLETQLVILDRPGASASEAAHGPGGRATLLSAASLVLDQPLARAAAAAKARERVDRHAPNGRAPAHAAPAALPVDEPLREAGPHGGFSADGTEYVIRMPWVEGHGPHVPPLPWVNVIANPGFGFLVSETGAASTWAANSREHRLTPWTNDPVRDPHGEALYLRDEETGEWWSPTAGPAPRPSAHEMRHGFGYSTARSAGGGLEQEVTYFALADAPARVARVRVTNRTDRARRISFWSYARLVLGVLPEESARWVVTERDDATSALLARNPMAGEFAGRVAFAVAIPSAAAVSRSATCDRAAFLGAAGSPARPEAVSNGRALDGAFGAGLDPCFAEQLTLAVAPGATAECAFALGECDDASAARSLVERLGAPGAVERELAHVRESWRELVTGIAIETPEPALDLMVNGWLAYQTLSCRIWGRTAFYQSGGAFGFRDQLQDAASLLHLRPSLAREQILLHAAHQFVEGDVLHWWHPPLAKGIRTRFADDLLWLPLLTSYYVSATGDTAVLDERARFLTAPPLPPGEDEVFLVPKDSGQSADVYEHCCRAIDRSLVRGAHGLPLFGTGDWNDGMNRVGREGRGESVWMGFFLYAILGEFVPLAERRGDHERAARYSDFRAQLRVALDDGGWDGEWYRRAYYDNGEPMGSRTSDECRIDGLAQAWAVISRAANPERARMAMDAVRRELVAEDDGLIRLLTPAFQDTPNDPGYIKGYVKGVRENGGQYTHAALWIVRAFAELGEHDLAARLLAMLSPVSHTRGAAHVERYRTEPYVVVADVYGEPPHVGRGGWTWYTGSAGWMLRVAIESILGIQRERGVALRLRPCTPGAWREYRVRYRVPESGATYAITVRCPGGDPRAVVRATLDGVALVPEGGSVRIPLDRASGEHRVELELGAPSA